LQGQAKEKTQPRPQVIELDSLSRRDQKMSNVLAEPFARKNHQAGDRPRLDVIYGAGNLLFGASSGSLVFTFNSESFAGLLVN